jgi:hypothetical protein
MNGPRCEICDGEAIGFIESFDADGDGVEETGPIVLNLCAACGMREYGEWGCLEDEEWWPWEDGEDG